MQAKRSQPYGMALPIQFSMGTTYLHNGFKRCAAKYTEFGGLVQDLWTGNSNSGRFNMKVDGVHFMYPIDGKPIT